MPPRTTMKEWSGMNGQTSAPVGLVRAGRAEFNSPTSDSGATSRVKAGQTKSNQNPTKIQVDVRRSPTGFKVRQGKTRYLFYFPGETEGCPGFPPVAGFLLTKAIQPRCILSMGLSLESCLAIPVTRIAMRSKVVLLP